MASRSIERSDVDLHRVEHLLDRCWSELDGHELNVKLMDVIRLMELKSKLAPAADAERTFWSMIDRMRHETLPGFGSDDAHTDVTPLRIEFAE